MPVGIETYANSRRMEKSFRLQGADLDLRLAVESFFPCVDYWHKSLYQLAQLQPQAKSQKELDLLHYCYLNKFPSRSHQHKKYVPPRHQ